MNLNTMLLGTMCVLSLSAARLGAASKPIVGNWECVATTPTGAEMHWTLAVTEQDGKLAGKALSEQEEIPLIEPKLEDDVFSFKVVMNSESYEVRVKLNGPRLDGTWKGGGETGSIKGTKKT